jgi:hypothetical protein
MRLFPDANLEGYREAQAAIQLPGVAMVGADDLQHYNRYHLSADGNRTLGQRMALAWVNMTQYRKNTRWSRL